MIDIKGVTAASLSDAMRKIHPHAHHVLDLVSPTPERVAYGPAITMLFAPLRADVPKDEQSFEKHLARAVAGAPPDPILVAAAPGVDDAAIAGGVRLAQLARAGVAGLVTTARMRDWDEARAMDLACWCRGETPFAGSAEAMPVATNIPIALGGATVMPGDIILASSAGAVILPAKDAERAIAMAREIEAADAARRAPGGR